MKPWRLSTRLIVSLTASITLMWSFAVVVSALVINHEMEEIFDSALQETAQRLLPLMLDTQQFSAFSDDDLDDLDERTIADLLEPLEHNEYLRYQARTASGRMLVRSHDAPIQPFDVALRPGYENRNGWRYYTESAPTLGIWLQVAEPLAHRREALVESLVGLAAPLVLLIPLSVVAILVIVRRTLRPVETLRRAIAARSGADLTPLSEPSLPQELSPIVDVVNRLLERLGRALDNERTFAANSAHELRTPIAVALAQAQRLSNQLKGTEKQVRADQVVSTIRRLAHLAEKLLQLARAEAGIALRRAPTDLLPVLRLVVDEFSNQDIGADKIVLNVENARSLMSTMDLDAFAIVMRNLIGNALTHGKNGGTIDIEIDKTGCIHVVNDCAVLPDDELRSLTERFSRGSKSGSGSGLGLAIVNTMLTQSGGSLTLCSPAAGRPSGFEAVIKLPTDARDARPGGEEKSAER